MFSDRSTILITGAAGFIGSALVRKLLKKGEKIIGIDNLNSYYDPNLKKDRLIEIEKEVVGCSGAWNFYELSIEDDISLSKVFKIETPNIVVNLAAQAGVRYSLENPSAYLKSNLLGFGNVLEACRNNDIDHLVYASSSSVYGGNHNLPFQESQGVNHPVSLYAATKKANELMAHTYSHLYQLPATALRFFTVYGPWGRPDMAPMLFTKSILSGVPIRVNNYGRMQRDFTYIDDIVEGLSRCCYKPATPNPSFDSLHPDPATSSAPHRIFNIGNSQPIDLLSFIELIEKTLGIKAKKDFQPLPPGDVIATAADTKALESWIGFRPMTTIEEGVKRFLDWYLDYYQA
ncbi:NAD-dependent epimerase [Prochlorococcus sp. MIT 1307]|uniref:NAD-dependent epimerase n=1 Tax=Prochlorococcus sp. MIT 1307 TaxID=3096219 RepID=UPI002A765D50|nr:NAD-dependent epimerase [Prochlorococcus sp. MIT 1307]